MAKTTAEVVVMCGGMGRRMGVLAMKYGCKSLIPIEGRTALEYVLRALKSMEFRKIILCVDRDELAVKVLAVAHIVGVKNIEMYKDRGLGTVNALYELRGVISSPQVLVLFGHHLITPAHLAKILSRKKQTSDIEVSLYRTSSDDLRKITALRDNAECKYLVRGTGRSRLKKDEYYVDVPYFVPRQFVNSQSSIPIRSYDALKSWFDAGNKLIGVESDFPHEFHRPSDLPRARAFTRKLLLNL